MRKITNIDIKEQHTISLRFLSDGSIVLKKGSTTIQKNGSSATVLGGMTKSFTEDVVENINLVQKSFTSWMLELRESSKGILRDYYHGEELLITSIKYTRVVTTLVEDSLPCKPQTEDKSVLTSNEETKDSEQPLSESGSNESEFYTPTVSRVLSVSSKRYYSTHIPSHVRGSDSVSLVPYVSPALNLVPRKISILRDVNGSFYLDWMSKTLLNIDSPDLRDHLSSLIAEIRSLSLSIESVNVRGYCNITRLSDVPLLSSYLYVYVHHPKSEIDAFLKSKEGLERIGMQGVLKALDEILTPGEKLVLLPWLSSLLNLNLYYLIIEVLDRLGIDKNWKGCITKLESLPIDEKESIYDLIEDLKTYSELYHGRLNPTIRESMRQRGLTISENVYCGFDTEYKNLDMNSNTILSAQWAVNSKLVLSVPNLIDYNLSVMNIDTGKEYPINRMWLRQGKIMYLEVQDEIRRFVNGIRSKRFGANDQCIKKIASGLIKEGIPYFIDKNTRQINFSFERTPIKTYFKSTGLDELDLEKLVQVGLNLEGNGVAIQKKLLIEKLSKYSNIVSKSKTENLLFASNFANLSSSSEIVIDESSDLVEKELPPYYKGRYSRTRKGSFTPDPISVTTRRNFYVIGHLTQADMCLLSDFDTIKKDFDIVNKCMVTLGRSSIVKYGHSIIFRDTLLLAPGGKKSLASIGGMYGPNLQKIDLSESQYNNMDLLLKENPILFKAYALRDSIISLYHACILEDAHFKLNKVGIPLTLSILGSSNLRHSWSKLGYDGYQISSGYNLGDSAKTPTPKGLFTVGDVGLFLNNYIANYKGGRNESFMIGKSDQKMWYDYDLTAAYTTVMSMMGDPNYELARRISPDEIRSMTSPELLYSYTTIEVKSFEFPDSIQYPSIPCYADELTTCYPRHGKAVLTGSEYITALNQGCEMELSGGTLIPFKMKEESTADNLDTVFKSDWEEYKSKAFGVSGLSERWFVEKTDDIFVNMPFRDVITDLQKERGKHLKGTISNLLYKEMGNSIYGAVCRGVSHKVRYDIKTDRMVRMESSEISNPILGSWITSFVRSLLGELMHGISIKGGNIVSCTTDGFITDFVNLEEMLSDMPTEALPLLNVYRKTRKELSSNCEALELKHDGIGLMSWTTRGQLSTGMNLKAITGLQTKDQSLVEISNLISPDVDGPLGNTVTFISESLRSPKDLIKHGGHVTMGYRDQTYRVNYDNKRRVTEKIIDGLLCTEPWDSVHDLLVARAISKEGRGDSLYQRNTSKPSGSKYKSKLELGLRTFVKDVVNNRNGVCMMNFNNYSVLKDFIRKYLWLNKIDLKVPISSKYISRYKISSIGKRPKLHMVPRSLEVLNFFDYVKSVYPGYDVNKVLKKV